MANKKGAKDKKKKEIKFIWAFFRGLFLTLRFVLTIPFYLLKLIFFVQKKLKKKIVEKKVKHKRDSIVSSYDKFRVVNKISGDYDSWESYLMKSESTIGIILGARGTGKSALALKIFENLYKKTGARLYAIGFSSESMPSWVECVDEVSKIKNDSHILIDEGGILFNSRNSMSGANKLLSELMLVARHKNLSILFISQNSSNLEVNILRQADYLILKPSSLLQKSFERKIVKELYTKTQSGFREFKADKGICYVHSDKFTGFISNPLPSFWNVSISKSWK